MHVLLVYMLCDVHPSLVSWVFVEYCSRETPGIQVGAGNISYHSQITKQTNRLICQTVTLYTDNAGYIVYVDMDRCVGGIICEAVYLYARHTCIFIAATNKLTKI